MIGGMPESHRGMIVQVWLSDVRERSTTGTITLIIPVESLVVSEL